MGVGILGGAREDCTCVQHVTLESMGQGPKYLNEEIPAYEIGGSGHLVSPSTGWLVRSALSTPAGQRLRTR
jgi:hypothetical protein